MSCPAKDGRHVPSALRVGHSDATAATAVTVMVVVVAAHVVARPVLGARSYCLVAVATAAANVAAASAGAAAAAAIVVDDVAGRVQRRLAGVVQPVQRVLLLGRFEMNSEQNGKSSSMSRTRGRVCGCALSLANSW